MHKLTVHNLGNADCIRIDLENGKKVLFDYADRRDPTDSSDLKCDLPKELREDLDGRRYYDVVAFTHLDKDHYGGSTKFFRFDHIKKYQGDIDGEPRIEMRQLWVPAGIIVEALGPDATDEAKEIQSEARERFKAKKGILVFSRPKSLDDWCERSGINIDERKALIINAGRTVPAFSSVKDGVEFFVHSPFSIRQEDCTLIDRNEGSLVMHLTFTCQGQETRVVLGGDTTHDVLTEIVNVTEDKENFVRLEWDIFKLPHHCSYTTLSDEKGIDRTTPVATVARLFESYKRSNCIVVSTSDTIPTKGDKRDKQIGQNPPHRQAANYFKHEVVDHSDQFIVTMEHPTKRNPVPLVITIDQFGATLQHRPIIEVGAAAATVKAPRAGS